MVGDGGHGLAQDLREQKREAGTFSGVGEGLTLEFSMTASMQSK